MPDNPIKHSEIIQQGNPFDQAIKGLEKLLKLTKQMRKEAKTTANERVKQLEKTNTATKEGKKLIEQVAKETKELTDRDKELLRIEKQIEKEKTKLSLANSKEAKQLADLKEKNRLANAEMRKTVRAQQEGRKSTNTWGKALGSFAAKFNTIGNVAAMAIGKITAGLKRAINQFTSLEKIIRSNQITSDNFDKVMARMEGSFQALNRALALGDLSNIGRIMKEAAAAAEDYVVALDVLGDTQRALDIQNARSRRRVKELQEIYNNTANDVESRMTAATEAQRILIDLQEKQQRISTEAVKAELEQVKGQFQLTSAQADLFKRFIENYGLLTDEQVNSLAALRDQQNKIQEGSVDLTKQVRGASTVMMSQADATKVVNDEGEKFNQMAAELSRTLGFDVMPLMTAVVGVNDDWRQQIADVIIEMDNQLGATQRLKSANAAMIGTIIRTAEAEEARRQASVNSTSASDQEVQNTNAETEAIEIKNRAIDTSIIKQKELNDIKYDTIGASRQEGQAVAQTATDTQEADKSKVDSTLNAFSLLGDASQAFAEDNAALSISGAIVDGIASVVATWKNAGGFPAGIAAAAAQAAIIGKLIASARSQKFAEGEVNINGPSHARGGIAAEIEGGESVINKRSTARYTNLLEAINANDSNAIANAALQNEAFHDVWKNSPTKHAKSNYSDPWTKKLYELQAKTPVNVPSGPREEYYPATGKRRIING